MAKKRKKKRRLRVGRLLLLLAIFALLILLIVALVYKLFFSKPKEEIQTEPDDIAGVIQEEDPASGEPEDVIEEAPPVEEEPQIDPSVFTDTDSLLLVANKSHKLPDGYVPKDLVTTILGCEMRQEAADALAEMVHAAEPLGVYLKISSAYRGEDYQRTLYNGYVGKYGTETADTISSRPGYSDHQTGLACDFVEGDGSMNGINFNQSFEDTASGVWLREHAHEYGFIMRYPKDKAEITGYAYEPWHYRYVGVDAATEIWNVDVFESLEEYYGVSGGDYLE